MPLSNIHQSNHLLLVKMWRQVWDKGVSMKEYISQKFEPSEDDRELSRVITKAISPRKSSSQATSFSCATNMVAAPNSVDNKAPLLANTNESEFLF